LPGRAARIAFERGGLLGFAVLVLYVWLAPAHIVDGDNAEFSTLGALGGSAHPSGYPLYVLWLRATAWLPGGSAAHTAGIATAVLGAASIVMLHAAARAWGARPLAASLACAVFAGAPVVLAMYTEAEVFALNGLVVATVAWLAARHGPLAGEWRAGALGLVAGLGLSNHLTCVLVAPIGILGLVRGAREAQRAPVALALAAAGLVVGLTPYLYLLVAPVHAASWGEPKTLGDVLTIFLRREYGGPSAFAGATEVVPMTDSLVALAMTLLRTWWWLLAAAGLAAAALRAYKPREAGETRAAWACWLASFAIAGPMLVIQFNVPPEGVGAYVVARFHILPALLLAIPIAEALDPIAARIRSQALGGVLALAVFAGVAGTSLPHVLHVHAPAVEAQAVNMLRTLPPNALVVGVDDDLAGGTLHAQLVLHVRPDVDYVHRPMFGLPWYRDRRRARGFDLHQLIDTALAQHRPVFVQGSERDVLGQLPHYRYGILFRVLPRGERLPSLDEIVAVNKGVFEKWQLDYERPGPDDEWATVIHERYARTWIDLGQQLAAAGKYDDARAAFGIARVMGPTR
jgi:hypothetical protein